VQTEQRQAWRDAVKGELEKILGPLFGFQKRKTGKYMCFSVRGGIEFETFHLHLDDESLQCHVRRTYHPLSRTIEGEDFEQSLEKIDAAIQDLLIYKAIKIASQKWSYTDLIGDLTNDT